jgi:hypothetical protein
MSDNCVCPGHRRSAGRLISDNVVLSQQSTGCRSKAGTALVVWKGFASAQLSGRLVHLSLSGGETLVHPVRDCLKYTLPAFLVPFAFVLTDSGQALLGLRSFGDMAWTTMVAGLAVGALAVVTGGWLFAVPNGPSGSISLLLADDQRNHPIRRIPIPPVRRIYPDQLGPVALSLIIGGVTCD